MVSVRPVAGDQPGVPVCSLAGPSHLSTAPATRPSELHQEVNVSSLHFTSLADLFTQTPSQLLWEASSHMLQLMREGCSYTYPPLSITRSSFIKLSELEQCRVKKCAQGFNTITQDLNLGSLSPK